VAPNVYFGTGDEPFDLLVNRVNLRSYQDEVQGEAKAEEEGRGGEGEEISKV
jgi:hypothetical protein